MSPLDAITLGQYHGLNWRPGPSPTSGPFTESGTNYAWFAAAVLFVCVLIVLGRKRGFFGLLQFYLILTLGISIFFQSFYIGSAWIDRWGLNFVLLFATIGVIWTWLTKKPKDVDRVE